MSDSFSKTEGSLEGRKEYRVILQKLKVPEVSSPILVKREGEKHASKGESGDKTFGKKL